MVLYQDDYMAMMPRQAADVSMRQVPLARRLNASACLVDIMRAQPESVTREDDSDFVFWHTMERCNWCVVQLAGWWYGRMIGWAWS